MKESLKREVRDRDKVCRLCGSDARLDVHHIRDVIGDAYQTEVKELLITLCRECHGKIHKSVGRNKWAMRRKLLLLFGVDIGECGMHRWIYEDGQTICFFCRKPKPGQGEKALHQ